MSDRVAVLARGKIQQIGSPIDLYERPANEFVAGFIGVSNLIDRDGQRLMVRPEKIHLLVPGDAVVPGSRLEDGEVVETVYGGMVTRYVVKLDQGGQLLVVQPNRERPSDETELRGRRVRVAWRPEQSFVISEHTNYGLRSDSTDEAETRSGGGIR